MLIADLRCRQLIRSSSNTDHLANVRRLSPVITCAALYSSRSWIVAPRLAVEPDLRVGPRR